MFTLHVFLHAVLILSCGIFIHLYLSLKAEHDSLSSKLQQQDSKLDLDDETSDTSHFISIGSSVWCHGNHHTNRTCRFRNLCYSSDKDVFLFFHSTTSIQVGVPKNRFSPTLLDLSSIEDHNMQYFNFWDMPASSTGQFSIHLITGTSLIFKRFNPDNLMHVLHDDLLPMFFTLQDISLISELDFLWDRTVQLVFIEGWIAGQFINLYELFSNKKPLLKNNLSNFGTDLVCFQHAFVGITKRTTWYQYGFKIPQGPLPNSETTSRDIRQFTNFILDRLYISSYSEATNYGVLLSRGTNRLILNEDELIQIFSHRFNTKILTMSLETHSITDMITAIKKASILLGMHGSLLSLAMFLSPGAIFIELFPYGVNPKHYTPYKTLATLPGMGIIYQSWCNQILENTITHEEYPEELGGINHLPQTEQLRILSNDEIQPHLCCQNPEWLFRIYQDTVVDPISFVEVIKIAMYERDKLSVMEHSQFLEHFQQKLVFPGEVSNLSCKQDKQFSPGLHLFWNLPWNVPFLHFKDIKYEVWLQEKGTDNSFAWILRRTDYFFQKNLKTNTEYNIWVRCIGDDNIGPFNHYHVGCTT